MLTDINESIDTFTFTDTYTAVTDMYIMCTCLNSAVKSTVKCAAATAVAMGVERGLGK